METGTFIKTKMTRMRMAISGLENLLLLLVAVVTILGVIAISSRVQRGHLESLLAPKPGLPADAAKAAQHP